jgi:hypothetical protein
MSDPITLDVTGTARMDGGSALLLLDERLEGHDTFLSGSLELGNGDRLPVTILTFDDVTVLHPSSTESVPPGTWAGRLHLRHGLRARSVPDDLAAAASRRGRRIDAMDEAEARYAVTFLGEAANAPIRAARIDVIVNALPVMAGGLR